MQHNLCRTYKDESFLSDEKYHTQDMPRCTSVHPWRFGGIVLLLSNHRNQASTNIFNKLIFLLSNLLLNNKYHLLLNFICVILHHLLSNINTYKLNINKKIIPHQIKKTLLWNDPISYIANNWWAFNLINYFISFLHHLQITLPIILSILKPRLIRDNLPWLTHEKESLQVN